MHVWFVGMDENFLGEKEGLRPVSVHGVITQFPKQIYWQSLHETNIETPSTM